MAKFDRSHSYQFVLFFAQNVIFFGQPSAPAELGEIVSRHSGAGGRLGLKFGPPQMETVLSQSGAMQVAAWSAGGGIWKMSHSLQRLDLVFDAMGFSDISQESVSVRSVCDRVSKNLAEALEALAAAQRPVVRAALVLTAQSSAGSDGSASVLDAARSFLAEGLRELSVADKVDDLSVRLNRTAHWTLDGADWLINRIEAVSVDASFKPTGDAERVFAWQLDANTSPGNGMARALSPAALVAFLESARDWIAERFESSEAKSASVH